MAERIGKVTVAPGRQVTLGGAARIVSTADIHAANHAAQAARIPRLRVPAVNAVRGIGRRK